MAVNTKLIIFLLVLGIVLTSVLIYLFWNGNLQAENLFNLNSNEVEGITSQAGGGLESLPVTSGATTYTPTSKTICDGSRCTKEIGGAYIKQGKDWVDWRNAVSLLKDKRFKIIYLKNDTGTWLDIIDFNYTSIKIQGCVNSTFNLKDVPLSITDLSGTSIKSNYNLTKIRIPTGCYNVTLPISLLGRQIKFGSKSTIVTITNPSGYWITSGDSYHYDSTWNLAGAGPSAVVVTINTTSIPDTATIEGVDFAFMSGLACAEPPTCTAEEILAGIDESGPLYVLNVSHRFDGYGPDAGEALSTDVYASIRRYTTGDLQDYQHYFAPGSTEWGGISGYPAVGFNLTQWLIGNSNATTDLQNKLSTDEFSFGVKAENWWLENTGDAPQNAVRLRVTYSFESFNVSECRNITSSGNYIMNNSILNTPGNPCINIQVDNVLLDCDGYAVDGTGILASSTGIATTYGATKNNVTIQYCNVSDYGTLVYGASTFKHSWLKAITGGYGWRFDSGNAYVNNVTVIYPPSASGRAFYLNSGTSVFINNSLVNTSSGTATSSNMFGVWMGSNPTTWTLANSQFVNIGVPTRVTGSSGRIYNNYFNTQSNPVEYSTFSTQKWNTTLTSSPNIAGGSYIGGNYWAKISTGGYSETCTDIVAPIGICDSEFIIQTNDRDYLPLSSTQSDLVAPAVAWLSPQNNSYMNGNILLYVSSTDNFGVANINFSYSNASISGRQIAVDTNSPYQTLWGTTNIGAGEYTLQANSTDVNGLSNSTYITINIDKNVPLIQSTETLYPTGQTAIRNGQNASLRVNVTDGAGAGIKNATINVFNINGTNRNISMRFMGGSTLTGEYSMWEFNITTNTTTGTKSVPFFIADNSTPSNIAIGNIFILEVDNDVPQYSGFTDSSPVFNNTLATFQVQATDRVLKYINFSSNLSGSWVNETIDGVSGASYLASINKLVYTGNWSYKFYFWDEVGLFNETTTENIQVFGITGGVLSVFQDYPPEATSSTNLMWNFSYHFQGQNVTNCSLYINGVNNLTQLGLSEYTIYNYTDVNLSAGDYTWNVECFQLDNETTTSSDIRNLYILDWAYPIFTSIWSNNKTIDNNASQFNATITHTNGTGGIEISGTNYSSNYLGSNKYNVTINLTTPATYSYYWWAYGNGTSGLYNWSSIYFHSVLQSCIQTLTNTSWGSWENYDCSVTQQRQQRNLTQYDSNACGVYSNTSFFEYQLIGNNWQNTSWSGWLFDSCIDYSGFHNETRNLTQFDNYNCGTNTTFFENRSVVNATCVAPDTTPPTWTNCRNLTGTINQSFSQSITATDASGISGYFLNHTIEFNVTLTTGAIFNITDLDIVYLYDLNLSVNDTNGNRADCLFWINITEAGIPGTTTTVSASQCKYKKFGYYNELLPWYRRRNCL